MILQPPKKSPVSSTTNDGLMSSADKIKLNNSNIAYGTCSTAAATAAKVVSISGNTKWTLTAGSIIAVKFTNTNTASNPTLNVNSTGAKSIVYNTAVIASSNLSFAGYANRYILYLYDGTNYVFIGWSIDNDMNTTYSNASLGQGYGTCATEEATTAKVVTLSGYALSTGGVVAVKFTYAVPASATMNINSKGAKAIYYRGAAITAGVIKAGDTATFVYNGSQYHLLTIDRDDGTTYNEMAGATSSAAGKSGLVPAPAAGKQASFLRGDGTWVVPTDTKVTNTLNTTAKAYVTGTTSSSTNTGTQVFDTGVYLDTTAGMLTATTFKGALSGNASTSTKLASSSCTTISIATSDWSTNSSGGYVCTKTLSSAMAYTNFNFDVVLSTDQSAAKLQIEAWNCVIADGNITQTTSNGSTTAFSFYAFTTRPSVALTIAVQGVS